MNEHQKNVAARCLAGAEDNAMTFPEIIGALSAAGFEGYHVDYRAGRSSYHLAEGGAVDLALGIKPAQIAAAFDGAAILAAIREAQALAPGYTYRGFCDTVRAAGCAGYMVSFSGRRALYYGRTAETHLEHFPR